MGKKKESNLILLQQQSNSDSIGYFYQGHIHRDTIWWVAVKNDPTQLCIWYPSFIIDVAKYLLSIFKKLTLQYPFRDTKSQGKVAEMAISSFQLLFW